MTNINDMSYVNNYKYRLNDIATRILHIDSYYCSARTETVFIQTYIL